MCRSPGDCCTTQATQTFVGQVTVFRQKYALLSNCSIVIVILKVIYCKECHAQQSCQNDAFSQYYEAGCQNLYKFKLPISFTVPPFFLVEKWQSEKTLVWYIGKKYSEDNQDNALYWHQKKQ